MRLRDVVNDTIIRVKSQSDSLSDCCKPTRQVQFDYTEQMRVCYERTVRPIRLDSFPSGFKVKFIDVCHVGSRAECLHAKQSSSLELSTDNSNLPVYALPISAQYLTCLHQGSITEMAVQIW
jgi:hypothetical protein